MVAKGPTGKNERWFAACVGMKGDLRWFQKLSGFSRSFASQIASNTAICHECTAGTHQHPFQDGALNSLPGLLRGTW